MSLENFNYYSDPRVVRNMAGKPIIIKASRQYNEITLRMSAFERECEALEYINFVDGKVTFEAEGDDLEYYKREYATLPEFIRNAIEYHAENNDGSLNEITVSMPCKHEICPMCDGDGHVVDPSIDSGGITEDMFYDDPQFHDDYFEGRYDVTCPECGGERIVSSINYEADMDEYQKAILEYIDQLEREREREAYERAQELKWGW